MAMTLKVKTNDFARTTLQRKLDKSLIGEVIEYKTPDGKTVSGMFQRCAVECYTGTFHIAFIVDGKRYEDTLHGFCNTMKKLTSRNKVHEHEVFETQEAYDAIERLEDLKAGD